MRMATKIDHLRLAAQKNGPVEARFFPNKIHPYQRMKTRGAVSSSLDEKLVVPVVTVTTTGWSPAPLRVDGNVKSTVYTPGSSKVAPVTMPAPLMVTEPIRIEILAGAAASTPVK